MKWKIEQMAKEDNSKEGVDFVWVDKGGYKTRKFLSSAEKAAKNAPDKPVVAKPKAKAKAITTSPIPKKRPVATSAVRPEGKAAGMPKGVTTAKVAGRGGYASGPAAGIPQNKSIKHYEDLIKSGVGSASEIRSAKAVLAILRKEAGMPTPEIKPTYDTTPAKGRMLQGSKGMAKGGMAKKGKC